MAAIKNILKAAQIFSRARGRKSTAIVLSEMGDARRAKALQAAPRSTAKPKTRLLAEPKQIQAAPKELTPARLRELTIKTRKKKRPLNGTN